MQESTNFKSTPRASTDTLVLWRTLPPNRIDAGRLSAVHHFLLSGPVRLMDRRWPAAARGDAAFAVGLAVDCVHHAFEPTTIVADLAMTAVLPHARAGNPAAVLVMAHALAALARAQGCDRARTLSEAWAARGSRANLRRARRRS